MSEGTLATNATFTSHLLHISSHLAFHHFHHPPPPPYNPRELLLKGTPIEYAVNILIPSSLAQATNAARSSTPNATAPNATTPGDAHFSKREVVIFSELNTLFTVYGTVMILVARFLFLHVKELIVGSDGRRQCVVLKTSMIIEGADVYRARLRLASRHRKLVSRGRQARGRSPQQIERKKTQLGAKARYHMDASAGGTWDEWMWPRWGGKTG